MPAPPRSKGASEQPRRAAHAARRDLRHQLEVVGVRVDDDVDVLVLIAAAEAAGPEVVLWSFDRDLEVICEHTGQPADPEESTGAGR